MNLVKQYGETDEQFEARKRKVEQMMAPPVTPQAPLDISLPPLWQDELGRTIAPPQASRIETPVPPTPPTYDVRRVQQFEMAPPSEIPPNIDTANPPDGWEISAITGRPTGRRMTTREYPVPRASTPPMAPVLPQAVPPVPPVPPVAALPPTPPPPPGADYRLFVDSDGVPRSEYVRVNGQTNPPGTNTPGMYPADATGLLQGHERVPVLGLANSPAGAWAEAQIPINARGGNVPQRINGQRMPLVLPPDIPAGMPGSPLPPRRNAVQMDVPDFGGAAVLRTTDAQDAQLQRWRNQGRTLEQKEAGGTPMQQRLDAFERQQKAADAQARRAIQVAQGTPQVVGSPAGLAGWNPNAVNPDGSRGGMEAVLRPPNDAGKQVDPEAERIKQMGSLAAMLRNLQPNLTDQQGLLMQAELDRAATTKKGALSPDERAEIMKKYGVAPGQEELVAAILGQLRTMQGLGQQTANQPVATGKTPAAKAGAQWRVSAR